MKRWLATLGVAGTLALLGAGAAAATVSYDKSSGTWFIGRGDVIAGLGKDALIDGPTVVWSGKTTWAFTCVYGDGTRIDTSYSSSSGIVYHARPRYAPGNRTITGYFAGPDEVFADFWAPGPDYWCYHLGAAEHGAWEATDVVVTAYEESFEFDGEPLPAPWIGGAPPTG